MKQLPQEPRATDEHTTCMPLSWGAESKEPPKIKGNEHSIIRVGIPVVTDRPVVAVLLAVDGNTGEIYGASVQPAAYGTGASDACLPVMKNIIQNRDKISEALKP